MSQLRWLTPRGRWRAFLGYAVGIAAGVVAWQVIGLNTASFVFVPLATTLAASRLLGLARRAVA